MGQTGSGFVAALEKIQQGLFRRGSTAHVIVAQEEFTHLLTVERRCRTERGGFESNWGRRGVRVESRGREMVIAGPEATTDLFMRGSVLRDGISACVCWRAPTREEGQRQIEAAPEKLDRATLADKVRAVLLHDGVRLHQDAPEAIGVDGVIGGMHFILITGDGVLHFARQRVDLDLDAKRAQGGHKLLVETSDGTWNQWHGFRGPITGENEEVMIDEVKLHLKDPALLPTNRDRGGGQPTCRHIERDMPPVVHRRTQCQPYLPDDLRPHMERIAGLLPCLQRERRPSFSRACCVRVHCAPPPYGVVALR